MAFDLMFQFLIAYVLAFFRLAGLMLMSPLFGSSRVPKRVKILFAMAATVGMATAVPKSVALPPNLVNVTFAIGGELLMGLLMGMIVSFTFIAAQWAGEMIGQQIGFNLAEVFDPQYGQAGSLVGDLYFMLTLMVFLAVGGDRALLQAVFNSFETVPLMSMSLRQDAVGLAMMREYFMQFVDVFTAATTLAMRLAAPMFFTMLVVDLAMGCIGKAMPQFNIMSAGLPVRSILGVGVLAVGLGVSSDAIRTALVNDVGSVVRFFTLPATNVAA